jgi:hypothetical protein
MLAIIGINLADNVDTSAAETVKGARQELAVNSQTQYPLNADIENPTVNETEEFMQTWGEVMLYGVIAIGTAATAITIFVCRKKYRRE